MIDDDNAKICLQSCFITDEENEAETSFDISDYFEGKTKYDLLDEDFKDTVIEWLEAQ